MQTTPLASWRGQRLLRMVRRTFLNHALSGCTPPCARQSNRSVVLPFLHDRAGSSDFMRWKCSFPGKKDSDWEGGTYPVTIVFPDTYPSKATTCQ